MGAIEVWCVVSKDVISVHKEEPIFIYALKGEIVSPMIYYFCRWSSVMLITDLSSQVIEVESLRLPLFVIFSSCLFLSVASDLKEAFLVGFKLTYRWGDETPFSPLLACGAVSKESALKVQKFVKMRVSLRPGACFDSVLCCWNDLKGLLFSICAVIWISRCFNIVSFSQLLVCGFTC